MDDLQTTLLKLGYHKLFMRLSYDVLEQIWNQPNAPDNLITLALDDTADPQARLLASEILFHKDHTFPPHQIRPKLVDIYCEGLKTASTGNAWVLPDNFIGTLGKHLLQFGSLAIEPLYALLDDERIILYEGSVEATTGNRLKVRVKDLSAFFISRLKRIPFALDHDLNTRDQIIHDLKNSLENTNKQGKE